MTNSPKIQSIVQEFIAKLSEALADESSVAIRSALSGLGGDAPRTRASGRRAAPRAAAPAKARRKGAKRAPDELEALTNSFLAHVRKNPGQRIETIGAELGISTKELALPVQKLRQQKAIRVKGQRRATTYFVK